MAFSIRRKNVRNDWKFDSRERNVDIAYVYARGVIAINR